MISIALLVPGAAFAQGKALEVSGWIPFWRVDAGIESITPELNNFTEVNPFVYTVRTNGTLNSESNLNGDEWKELRATARTQGIKFIPTITWAGSEAIHENLSDPTKRAAHVRAIAAEVYGNGFDGIDIDYEAKFARTRPYFSAFLKELQEAIGYDKWVMCTIEARTPLDSRYSSPEAIPDDIEYANEFSDINNYCDRVRIMAYDQGRYDLKLNRENEHPYVPVADTAWVEKVMRLAAEEIDKDKLVIGVPTYGYEYDMFEALDGSGRVEYSRLWSFNPGYADQVIDELDVESYRNSAGEMTLTYPARDSIDPSIPLPDATRVLSWSDAGAVQEKIDLAHELGLRGVALFKVDGGQDPEIWDVLAETEVANATTAKSVHEVTLPPVSATPSPGTPAPTTSAAGTAFTRDLELGDRGEDVRALQQYLNQNGFMITQSGPGAPGAETTLFGSLTQQALIRYQKAHSISPAVGYFGPVTRASI